MVDRGLIGPSKVFEGRAYLRIEGWAEHRDPQILAPTDAIIEPRLVAVDGTDRMLNTFGGVRISTEILGSQAVGTVIAVGSGVAEIAVGDSVLVSSSVTCGECTACRYGFPYARCPRACPGTASTPEATVFGCSNTCNQVDGMHADRVLVPFADNTLVRVPKELPDHIALLLSKVLPEALFITKLSEICAGEPVVVIGASITGLLAIHAAKFAGPSTVIALDSHADRLSAAESLDAAPVDMQSASFGKEIRNLAGGCVPYVIDMSSTIPFEMSSIDADQVFSEIIDVTSVCGYITCLAGGTASPWMVNHSKIVERNLHLQGGFCNHRKYIGPLISMLQQGLIPRQLLNRAMDEFNENLSDAYGVTNGMADRWTMAGLER